MVNYFWGMVQSMLTELDLLIDTSHHNMKLGPPESVDEEEKERAAVSQASRSITEVVEISQHCLSSLKCEHINHATRHLRGLLNREFSWSEANTRSRALRDAVQIELRRYVYFQYPLQKGQKIMERGLEGAPRRFSRY